MRAFVRNHREGSTHRISMVTEKKPVLRVTVFTDYI
jgi:hypothetical protein